MPRGSRAFGSLWESRLSSFMLVLLPFSDLDLFSFLFFFSFIGFRARISWSFLGFKPFGLTTSLFLISFSMALCVIPLGLGAMIF